jgi:putative tryptophan/tyrosine transport system substrate-binding protein
VNRREIIAGLGSVAAWPMVARAQGDRVRRIGVLLGGDENDPLMKPVVSAFTQGLADLGWTDGRNVRMDVRWASGDINRIRALARELVSLKPDILVTSGLPATVAVQRETRTIPIVFASVSDPIASGFVERLDRPSAWAINSSLVIARRVGRAKRVPTVTASQRGHGAKRRLYPPYVAMTP